jgi:hypothetical protein
MTPRPTPDSTPRDEPRSAEQTADDLLGQATDLLADGATPHALIRAFERSGFSAAIAQAVVDDLLVQLPASELGASEPDDGEFGIETVYLWRYLRRAQRGDSFDEAQLEQLRLALKRHGLSTTTATDLVTEVATDTRRVEDIQVRRMRRLGAQAMGAGAAFTAFFLWTAFVHGPGGKWNLATAAVTAGLAVFGLVLYARHRVKK